MSDAIGTGVYPRLPLSQVATRITDGSHFSPPARENGAVMANVKDMRSDQIDFASCARISASDFRKLKASGCTIRNGDVLLSKDGTVGRVLVYRQNEEIGALSSICIIEPKPGIIPEYLGQALKSEAAVRQYEAFMSGSALRRLILRDIRSVRVPVPPRETQSAIAKALQAHDAFVQQTGRVITKLRETRAGLLHDLLTRGVDENGELRRPLRQAPEMYRPSSVGAIPTGWAALPLAALAESLIDGPFGSNLKTSHYVAEPGVRVVRLQNIGEGAYDDADRAFVAAEYARKLHRNRVAAGDLLIASLGDDNHPVGRACCYPTSLPNAINKADCFRFRANELCRNDFIMYSMNHERIRQQVRGFEQGVTMKRINLGNLRSVRIAVPPLPEQERICGRLNTIDNRLISEQRQLAKLISMKTALADDLLAQRVCVTSLLAGKAESEFEGAD